MFIYHFLSVLVFLLRYNLITRSEGLELGPGAIRQLYLNYHKPFFKGSEESLLKVFKVLLRYRVVDEEFWFTIKEKNRIPHEPNSKESVDVLDHYEVFHQ